MLAALESHEHRLGLLEDLDGEDRSRAIRQAMELRHRLEECEPD